MVHCSREIPDDLLNIGDEHSLGASSLSARGSKHRRRMHGREQRRRPLGIELQSARLHDAEGSSEQGLGGGRSKADDHVRLDECNLVLEPRKTRADLTGAWCLMNASLRSRVFGPLEVLHRVSEVDVIAVEANGVERAIEQLARRPDEIVAEFVLDVPGLFADEHDACAARTLAEHGLGSALEQVAAAASLRCRPKLRQRRARRDKISGVAGWLRCSCRLRHADLCLPGDDDVLGRAGHTRRYRPAPVANSRIAHYRRAFRASLR